MTSYSVMHVKEYEKKMLDEYNRIVQSIPEGEEMKTIYCPICRKEIGPWEHYPMPETFSHCGIQFRMVSCWESA